MSNFTKTDVGTWDRLLDQVFESGPLKKSGKRFIGEELQTKGCEVSLNRLEAGDGYSFLHRHREHEEIYIAVRGHGQMLVDSEVIELAEGTVVKVSPDGVRSIRAASDESLDYICVQAKVGTLTCYGPTDGSLVPGDVDWEGHEGTPEP